MKLYPRHSWSVSPKEAIALQNELRGQLLNEFTLNITTIRLVAGVDVSVKNDESQAAVVVLSFPDMTIVENVTARRPTPFPYVPGLLSFREGPVLEEAFMKLQYEPDVFIFDGMGIAHPRRLGIAAHLGLWLEKPTIGCGKSLLCGKHEPVPTSKGSWRPLLNRNEIIGAALRTRENVSPVYISPGHHMDLAHSVQIVMACISRYRLPDPIREAHRKASLSSQTTAPFGATNRG